MQNIFVFGNGNLSFDDFIYFYEPVLEQSLDWLSSAKNNGLNDFQLTECVRFLLKKVSDLENGTIEDLIKYVHIKLSKSAVKRIFG